MDAERVVLIMIFYMQFNAANIAGIIQITNVKQEPLYYLIRIPPHWKTSYNLLNNYVVHDFHHQVIMTVDNIYFKNGHEGYLLNINDNAEYKVGILLAAVLNQTSRNTKNKRSLERLKGRQLRVQLKRNINFPSDKN